MEAAKQETRVLKKTHLIKQTRSERAQLIAEQSPSLMAQLRACAKDNGLIFHDGEQLVLTIVGTTKTEYQKKPLSRTVTVKWLKRLISPKATFNLGYAATENIEFILRNVDQSTSWWCDPQKPGRAKVVKFVNGPFQQLLNQKACIKAKPSICTWRRNSAPDAIGFEVQLGEVVDVALKP